MNDSILIEERKERKMTGYMSEKERGERERDR